MNINFSTFNYPKAKAYSNFTSNSIHAHYYKQNNSDSVSFCSKLRASDIFTNNLNKVRTRHVNSKSEKLLSDSKKQLKKAQDIQLAAESIKSTARLTALAEAEESLTMLKKHVTQDGKLEDCYTSDASVSFAKENNYIKMKQYDNGFLYRQTFFNLDNSSIEAIEDYYPDSDKKDIYQFGYSDKEGWLLDSYKLGYQEQQDGSWSAVESAVFKDNELYSYCMGYSESSLGNKTVKYDFHFNKNGVLTECRKDAVIEPNLFSAQERYTFTKKGMLHSYQKNPLLLKGEPKSAECIYLYRDGKVSDCAMGLFVDKAGAAKAKDCFSFDKKETLQTYIKCLKELDSKTVNAGYACFRDENNNLEII